MCDGNSFWGNVAKTEDPYTKDDYHRFFDNALECKYIKIINLSLFFQYTKNTVYICTKEKSACKYE